MLRWIQKNSEITQKFGAYTKTDNNQNNQFHDDSKETNDNLEQNQSYGHHTQNSNEDLANKFGANSNASYTDYQSSSSFGAHTNDNNTEFGTENFGASSEKSSNSFVKNFLNIFKLDSTGKWIQRGIISLIFFAFFSLMGGLSAYGVVVILNLILFPFLMCVVDHLLNKLISSSSFIKDLSEMGIKSLVIKVIIKYMFYYFVWGFSCFLGIIAIIYLYALAKKLG